MRIEYNGVKKNLRLAADVVSPRLLRECAHEPAVTVTEEREHKSVIEFWRAIPNKILIECIIIRCESFPLNTSFF